ncbi:hypothetical protein F5Y08DRAFT_354868 [Xylaria arbuscula]|nr:hypothetical protein F5Y08DRAFT_354868 [Xylaria arbuscula]
MSFGFGVGDFLAVIGLINKVRKDFIKAADQFPQICHDLGRLENTTRDIEVLLSEGQLSQEQQERLEAITRQCNIVLEDAKKPISQYSTLKSSTNNIREKISQLKDRFGWDPVDGNDVRSRINGILESCNFVVGMLNEENLTKLAKGQKRQEEREQAREDRAQKQAQQEVLDWLTSLNYAAQQSDFINQCEAGTGQWLLDSAEYRKWLSTEREALFCPGIPGAGKTMLASIVVDNLLHLHRDDEKIGICYIFVNFRRVAEQTVENLVASLIKQLESIKNGLSEHLRLLYEKHKKRGTRPSCKELCDTLRSLSANYSRIFMIVDALDEFQPQDNGFRSRFIDELLNLCSKFGVNIFVTSRFIPEITCKFDKVRNKIEIRASNDDIAKYMEGKLSSLPAVISRHPEFWTEIKREVVRCVDGMFLLARLHCDALRGQCTRKAVRAILTKLSRDSRAGSSDDKDAMLRSAPLDTQELRHALGVELDSTEFDVDNLPDLEDIVSYCCGLVIIDDESQVVRLVHYTTQEYFASAGSSLFPSANSMIAHTCITYLNYDVFLSGACFEVDEQLECAEQVRSAAQLWRYTQLSRDGEPGPDAQCYEQLGSAAQLERYARLKRYPLYGYFSRYGMAHTWSIFDHQFCYKFLSCASKVQACLEVSLYQQSREFRLPKGFTGLHLAASFGLHEALPVLREFYDPDTADEYDNTPMLYALALGHIPMVEALLESGVSANSIVQKKTLLMHAVSRETRSTYLVKFIRYMDTELGMSNEVGSRYRAQMSDDTENRTKLIVKFLLDKDADVNARDYIGNTAIAYAAQEGLESTVRLLLERGADVNTRDAHDGDTAIMHAARLGNETLVQLLLKRGADVNAKSTKNGHAAVFYAAQKRHGSIVRLLLENGADFDLRNALGRKDLSVVAEGDYRLYVQAGRIKETAEVIGRYLTSRSSTDWTKQGHEASRADQNMTALHLSAQIGDTAACRFFLKGANIESQASGRTPLSYAAGYNTGTDTVKFLIESEVDIDSRDSIGRTPLSYAASMGRRDIVQLLLERGADAEIRDDYYKTPLQYAEHSRNVGTIEVLRQKSTPTQSLCADCRKNEAQMWLARQRSALGK